MIASSMRSDADGCIVTSKTTIPVTIAAREKRIAFTA
jgi:hypothetical protein